MKKYLNFTRWIKLITQKVLGYLLFYIDDPKKRKEAFLLLNKQAKEKPVSLAGHHRQQTLFDDVRAVV